MNIFLFCIIPARANYNVFIYVPTEQDKSLRSKLLEICSIIITIVDPQLGDFYRVFVHRLISKLGNNALRSRKDSFLSRSKHSIFGRFNYKRLQPLVSGEQLESGWNFLVVFRKSFLSLILSCFGWTLDMESISWTCVSVSQSKKREKPAWLWDSWGTK